VTPYVYVIGLLINIKVTKPINKKAIFNKEYCFFHKIFAFELSNAE